MTLGGRVTLRTITNPAAKPAIRERLPDVGRKPDRHARVAPESLLHRPGSDPSMSRPVLVALVAVGMAILAAAAAPAAPSHAIAMHGEPSLPADFAHFPYVNPDAPKGGTVNYAAPGTFDSVNPFIVQGSGARGVLDLVL